MRSSQSHTLSSTSRRLQEIVVLVNCRRTNQDAMTHSGHITFPSSSPTCLLYSITIWHQKVARTESTQSKVKKGSIKQCPTGFSSLSLDWMPTITGTINWIECDNNVTGFCCSRISTKWNSALAEANHTAVDWATTETVLHLELPTADWLPTWIEIAKAKPLSRAVSATTCIVSQCVELGDYNKIEPHIWLWGKRKKERLKTWVK